jgi:hypothetical protein
MKVASIGVKGQSFCVINKKRLCGLPNLQGIVSAEQYCVSAGSGHPWSSSGFFSKTISHRSISKAPVDVVAAFLLATATPALIHHCLEAKI